MNSLDWHPKFYILQYLMENIGYNQQFKVQFSLRKITASAYYSLQICTRTDLYLQEHFLNDLNYKSVINRCSLPTGYLRISLIKKKKT